MRATENVYVYAVHVFAFTPFWMLLITYHNVHALKWFYFAACLWHYVCRICVYLCAMCMESISWPIFKLGHGNILRWARNVTQRIANQINQDINFNRHYRLEFRQTQSNDQINERTTDRNAVVQLGNHLLATKFQFKCNNTVHWKCIELIVHVLAIGLA